MQKLDSNTEAEIVKKDDDLDIAVKMHQLIDMYVGGYVCYEDKISNPEYANAMMLVSNLISPNERMQGNWNNFKAIERMRIVSEPYKVLNQVKEENKACLNSPEFSISYHVKKGSDNFEMKKLSNDIKVREFVNDKVYNGIYDTPNNIAAVNTNKAGEIELIIIDIENVISLSKKDNVILNVEFKYKDSIIIFNQTERVLLNSKREIVKSVSHNLGYCPAIQLSKKNFSANSKVVTSVFFPFLGKLHSLWFWSITGEATSLFAAHPITWYAKETKESDNNVYAENNFQDNGDVFETKVENNSSTNDGRKGVGAAVQIETELMPDGELPNLVKRLDPDIPTLDFLDSKPTKASNEILFRLTGVVANPTKSQINEKQVLANESSRNTILLENAKEVERVHRFLEVTIQKEKFGDILLGVMLDYGSKFDNLSKDQLISKSKEANATGQSRLIKEANKAIINFDNRNNHSAQLVEKIKDLLTPYYLKPQSELDKWLSLGHITYQDWYKATNIEYLINKFENEVVKVSDFDGSIEAIAKVVNDKIIEYIPKKNRK